MWQPHVAVRWESRNRTHVVRTHGSQPSQLLLPHTYLLMTHKHNHTSQGVKISCHVKKTPAGTHTHCPSHRRNLSASSRLTLWASKTPTTHLCASLPYLRPPGPDFVAPSATAHAHFFLCVVPPPAQNPAHWPVGNVVPKRSPLRCRESGHSDFSQHAARAWRPLGVRLRWSAQVHPLRGGDSQTGLRRERWPRWWGSRPFFPNPICEQGCRELVAVGLVALAPEASILSYPPVHRQHWPTGKAPDGPTRSLQRRRWLRRRQQWRTWWLNEGNDTRDALTEPPVSGSQGPVSGRLAASVRSLTSMLQSCPTTDSRGLGIPIL